MYALAFVREEKAYFKYTSWENTWGWYKPFLQRPDGTIDFKRPAFRFCYHFNSFAHLSIGIHISLLGPCLDIHIPTGFIAIGWQDPPEDEVL